MNEPIPIDLPQDIVDKMNARRYRKATPADVLKFPKYPFGLPRQFMTGIPLREKLTGKIWIVIQPWSF